MAASAGGLGAAMLAQTARGQARESGTLRVAHITDLHQMPSRNALKGIETGIDAMMRERPDLIVQTGDIMTGTMARPIDEAQRFMRDIESILGRDLGKPMIHAIGNHDIWGWTRSRSKATGDESTAAINISTGSTATDPPLRRFFGALVIRR
jgi:predicted MPP superfamily phosphohydrolase